MGLYYVLTMFRAKVLGSFSAAHSLREYRGDCERLHGHNYRVEVSVESDVQNATGLVMDFRDLEGLLKSVLDGLDHHYLNDLDAFATVNPSAENIARYIFDTLRSEVNPPVVLREVTVWENDTCCVTYSRRGGKS